MLILVLLVSSAFAGGKGGGGGDVLVCYNKKGKVLDVISYDHWNADQEYSFTVARDNKTPYMKQVDAQIEKIRKMDYTLAKEIKKTVEVFTKENIQDNDTVGFVDSLDDNGDGVQIVVPEKLQGQCKKVVKKRIATFKVSKELRYGEKPFLLSEHLWKNAPESTKYAVVIHEAIYKFIKENFNDVEDSKDAQYLNALYASEEFDSFLPFQYVEAISRLQLLPYNRSIQFSVLLENLYFNIGGFYYDFSREKENRWAEGYLAEISQNIIVNGKERLIEWMWMDYDNYSFCTDIGYLENSEIFPALIGEVKVEPSNFRNYFCFVNNDEGKQILAKAEVSGLESVYQYRGSAFPIYREFEFDLVTQLPKKFSVNLCKDGQEYKYNIKGNEYYLKGYYYFIFDERGELESFTKWKECK